MRISDWSSDVCSSDLRDQALRCEAPGLEDDLVDQIVLDHAVLQVIGAGGMKQRKPDVAEGDRIRERHRFSLNHSNGSNDLFAEGVDALHAVYYTRVNFESQERQV